MFALRALEFDRIVRAVVSLALTPLGAARLEGLVPEGEARAVAAALQATGETTRYLQANTLFPLRAGATLVDALASLDIEGRALEPLQLRTVAEFVDSVERTCTAIGRAVGDYPVLRRIAGPFTPFRREVEAVWRAIDASGEILDEASPRLRQIRDQLRQKRQRLRATLDQFVRGRDTAKYLQEQVVTERNGRYVLLVRAEHRGNVPGIVHGSSTSGASLFMEPAATVEVNNDLVQLQEDEREEIVRILLELTDAFRSRPGDLEALFAIAGELDVLQAKAHFGTLVGGVAPKLTHDAAFELRGARHPLLIEAVRQRIDDGDGARDRKPTAPVPIDVILDPPTRVLLITGPNTGGKTVALKTGGLFALMAQAGLHLPADEARLPVFRSIFADIGDEQSIANSLSTFSAHITNLVAMDREMKAPSLVLLDEVGTGTDPNEGGALATAIISHFKARGALVVATTHYDAVKTWGTATDGVTTAAFAFDSATFAPTYRLVYGAPGRSLALEIAQRLGMPVPVVAAARGFLSEDQKRLHAHLERVDSQARALDSERMRLQRERRTAEEQTRALAERERALAEREERFTRRLNERLDDRVRQARREIDGVIDTLKARAEELVEKAAAPQGGRGVTTGDAGAARTSARDAIDRIVAGIRDASEAPAAPAPRERPAAALAVGAKVAVSGLGMEGTLVAIHGEQAEVDVRGKRLRTPLRTLQALAGPGRSESGGSVRVKVDLVPREAQPTELNVIGCSVNEAVDRITRFLDEILVSDAREVRIVHGHGTGQLRRGVQAFLRDHPLVQRIVPTAESRGDGGATLVELKD